MSNEIRSGRHCLFNLHVHLVFVTKYRKNIFTKDILQSMRRIFEKITEENDVKLIEFEGEVDHVHLLLNYPPKITIVKLVNSLKGVSSRLLRREYPHLETIYYKGALWSPSYFAASCGGAPLDIIKQYIQNQNTPKH
jgi:putative transposase